LILKSTKIAGYDIFSDSLDCIKVECNRKTIINTINAHSYIVAKKDTKFKKALQESDILLPDGEGIVLMAKATNNINIRKIAGADIHSWLLQLANKDKLKCFYLGASQKTLDLIKIKQKEQYPNIEFVFHSPPFKAEFSPEDTLQMLEKINTVSPDILFVGMTAPKQEKWVGANCSEISAGIICSIGAVFDFVAETKKRAPQWIIDLRMEWLYRSFTALRLTKRYLYSTPLFLFEIFKLKYFPRADRNV